MQSSISHDPEPNFQQLKLAADKFLQNHKMLEFNLPPPSPSHSAYFSVSILTQKENKIPFIST